MTRSTDRLARRRIRLEPLALFIVAFALLLASPALSNGPRRSDEATAATTTSSECPADMVLVRGSFCPEVEQECLEWSADGRGRCMRFAEPSRCLSRRRVPMAYCVDRYEWPNRPGMHPDVMVRWTDARMFCEGRGRRLCTESEWTFACEGEQMLPYPYGYARDETACTIDHFARAPNKVLLHHPLGGALEASRVYEASASGSMPRCASPFGVMDMTGNVDEWVASESGVPFASALMGGFWGHVRTRCRAVTRGHNERFRYYQIGFRCCAAAAHPPRAT